MENKASDISLSSLSALSTLAQTVFHEKTISEKDYESLIRYALKNITEFQHKIIQETNHLLNEILDQSAKLVSELTGLTRHISNLYTSEKSSMIIIDSLTLIVDKSGFDNIKGLLNFNAATIIVQNFSEIFQIFRDSNKNLSNIKPTRSFQSDNALIQPKYSQSEIFNKSSSLDTEKDPLEPQPAMIFCEVMRTVSSIFPSTEDETLNIKVNNQKHNFETKNPRKRMNKSEYETVRKKRTINITKR